VRRSGAARQVPANVTDPRPVFLGDTMGELRKFYGLATVAFVGRSLVPLGGSDVMEVAGLAKPVLVGPYTENFTEAVELLMLDGGCVRVHTRAELADAVGLLLKDEGRRERMGLAARQAIVSRRGATARIVARLLETDGAA
jgi:3-deoxy-D-manno-octulosonic-acid transferase